MKTFRKFRKELDLMQQDPDLPNLYTPKKETERSRRLKIMKKTGYDKKMRQKDQYATGYHVEEDDPCWDGYTQYGMKKKNGKKVPNCVPDVKEAEYQGRDVPLNKPMKGDVKKSKVYVKNEKGNVVKVEYGDPNMKIKKNIPARRKSFRARHNCDNPGPKTKARYWSCKAW